jgi:arylsulfatase A-like enzyme
MNSKAKSISRKEALKRLGTIGMTIPFSQSFFSVASAMKPGKISSGKTKNKQPNILWITTEGVPISVLSCYGSKFMPTPNIDRIANEGMLFTNSFVNNALCAPSRATLLTGKYNHLNGMLTNPGDTTNGQTRSFFDPKQQTFAKILQKAGYKTGMVGKWHLVSEPGKPSNPGEAGFDYFVFKEGAGGPYYNPKGYFQNPSLGSNEIQEREYPGYITDNFTDLAIDGMKKLGEPFCMAVQFFSDHRPFDPPHKYEHIFDDVRFPEPGTFWDDYKTRSAAAREARMRIADMRDFNPPKDLTERQRQQWNYQQLMRHFLGTLKSQDDNVGRILDYLDKNKLTENTIVVFTGDHGFFLGEHGWFDKRFMYEEALRVPWMIRYPGMIKPGAKSDAQVASIDNAPTILDLCSMPIPDDMQGKSLVPVFKEKNPEGWPTSLYYHYYEFAPPHWVLPHYGIRTDRYKLISYYTINEWELFDLEKDPDEMDNLLLMEGMKITPGYEEVVKDLVEKLKEIRSKYKDETGNPVKFWPLNAYN